MSKIHAELFTPSQLNDPREGRVFLGALGRHMPSWMPQRYGQTQPLRHVYEPGQAERFWAQADGLMFRNARGTAQGEVSVRSGPWDILSKITLTGLAAQSELDSGGIGALLAECGASLDLSYAMAHIFTGQQAEEYYRAWFEIPPPGDRVKVASQGTFPYCLRDLYWANVFGPPYTELFGADRLRTAPAAVVTELRPGHFYLQVTSTISDLYTPDAVPRFQAARDAVKEHLGSDAFCQAGPDAPRRAPAWPTAAEEGLWTPAEGAKVTGELRALLEKARGR